MTAPAAEPLERMVRERTRALNEAVARLKAREVELPRSREEAIRRLARALELRDEMMGFHVERMSRYCAFLAEGLGYDAERCELVRLASQLHDIGKLAIPDRILGKRGPLSVEERRLLETHAQLGYEMLTGSGEPLVELGATIAWTHHERVDGSGYPRGLRASDIPLEGRIAAVADVFDALTTDRPYRPRMRLDQALVVLRSASDSFDPLVLDLFFANLDTVIELGGLGDDGAPKEQR